MSTDPKTFRGRDRWTRATRRSLVPLAALLVVAVVMSGCGPVGYLWGWGYNGQGQIGDSTTISRAVPVSIDPPLTRLSAGIDFTATTERNAPIQIGTATNWTEVEAGGVFTLGLRTGA